MAVKPYKKYKGKGQKYYFKYPDETGKWVERAGTTKYTETDELRAYLQGRAKLIRTGAIDPREMAVQANSIRPIAEVIAEFRADLATRVSPKHLAWTMSYLDRCIQGVGATCLRDLKVELVESWLNETFKSARSYNAALKVVRHLVKWAGDRHYMIFNPLAPLKCRHEYSDEDRITRVIERSEFDRLVRLCPPYRRVYYKIAAFAMVRWSEVARLTWAEIDLNDGLINIAKGSDKAKRGDVVPLYSELARELAAWRPDDWTPSGVVVGPCPRMPTWQRDIKKAGLDYSNNSGSLHRKCLRASAITWLLEAGEPLPHVARIARHQDPKITMKHYAKLRLVNLSATIERLTLATNKRQGISQDRATMGNNGRQDHGEDDAEVVGVTSIG